MRKAPAALLVVLGVPALSALPVVTAPRATAHPVTPVVRAVPITGVDHHALAGAAADRVFAAPGAREQPAALTPATRTEPFQLIGVTWRADAAAGVAVTVRVHTDQGWGAWTALEQQDQPDQAEAGVRSGTEPLWVGDSDGYQVRVDADKGGHSGAVPAGLRVDLVAPGSSAADTDPGRGAPAASAAAAVSAPVINSRAAWGADERLRSSAPRYSPTIKAGFVHHTAGTNNYSPSDVPKIIRGIYAYHTKANGWSDIGYNFLVDRFGRLWEGRYGGTTRPVIGAHTGGFNDDSFAVSAIGDYDTAAAPAAMVDSIARVMAWKLSRHYRDPDGTTVLTSTGGGTSRYSAGTRVRFDVISGHRDAGFTECPGTNLYRQLDRIRSLTADYLGAGLVSPKASADRLTVATGPLEVSAKTLLPQEWAIEIRNRCDGTVVRTMRGTAAPGSPITADWDLRGTGGEPVRAGSYSVTLSSQDSSGRTARSWRHVVSVEASSTSPPAVSPVPLPGAAGFQPVDPVRVFDTTAAGRAPVGPGQRTDVQVTGVGSIPSSGVGAVAFTVTSSCPTRGTYLSVWPAGSPRPVASTLNLASGGHRSALAVTAVGGDGRVSLRSAGATAELAVDVVGYFPVTAPGTAPAGLLLHPVTPFRLFDSRHDPGGRLAAGATRTLTMPSLGSVTPDQMAALVVNVTTTGATGTGTLTVQRPAAAVGTAVSATYTSGSAVATRAVSALSSGGRLQIANRGAATHVIVDVAGWYAPALIAGGTTFTPVTPTRVLDTRLGLGAKKRKVGAGVALTVLTTGRGKPVPAGASAVVVNLTATGATRSTYLTAWPAGTRRPVTSDLNVATGQTTANLVVVRLGRTATAAGKLDLFNAKGSTHLVGDVVGYYR